jgi:hypothetical protein
MFIGKLWAILTPLTPASGRGSSSRHFLYKNRTNVGLVVLPGSKNVSFEDRDMMSLESCDSTWRHRSWDQWRRFSLKYALFAKRALHSSFHITIILLFFFETCFQYFSIIIVVLTFIFSHLNWRNQLHGYPPFCFSSNCCAGPVYRHFTTYLTIYVCIYIYIRVYIATFSFLPSYSDAR